MKDIYSKRRNELLKDKKAPYIATFFAGNRHGFEFNRNFYYFTGIKRNNMILMIVKSDEGITSKLFIEPYDEVLAKWVGGRMRADEAKEISGVDSVGYVDDFERSYLAQLNALRGKEVSVGFDIWTNDSLKNPNEAIIERVRKDYPHVKIEDLWYEISQLRLVKDETEIQKLKQAQTWTLNALKDMMRAARGGVYEAELVQTFNLGLGKQNCSEYAFPAICAGGARATTLHYGDNNQIVDDGDLILVDLGSSCDFYCSDISRTFPANGKFTARQKEVYECVLGAQQLAQKMARPGISVLELNQYVIDYYKEELPKIGLCNDGIHTVRDYYYHTVSHSIGLECHDIHDRNSKMVAGMIISNEPGLYIAEEGIGIRIEDDLLITEDGAINLSKDFPHTTEEVEAIMASKD